MSIGEAVVTQDLVSYATNSVVQEAFDSMKLEWAFNIVSVCNSFNDVVDTFTSKPDYQPDYQKEIMNYSAKDTGYRVYIELKNGQMYALDTICDALR